MPGERLDGDFKYTKLNAHFPVSETIRDLFVRGVMKFVEIHYTACRNCFYMWLVFLCFDSFDLIDFHKRFK